MDLVTLVLQVSLTLLVSTAGIIFAVAEARTGIPAISAPLSIVTFFLVDHYRVWRPPNAVINGLGVLAFCLAGGELLLSDIEAPLLSGGHLLSYLTCVFLLQPKGRRQFWWLAALCLLQVSVASLLTYDSWFGLAMPVFLLLTLWTLAVFQLQQAAESAARPALEHAKQGANHQQTTPWLGRSTSTPAAQLDQQHRWITPRFVASMLSGTSLSLLLAGAFFLLIPRVWPSTNPIIYDGGRAIGGAPPRTGFTSRISLGHIGEIQESPRIALEARLIDPKTRQAVAWNDWPPAQDGDPLFRGAVREVYDLGAWRRWESSEWTRRSFRNFPREIGGRLRQITRIHVDAGDAANVIFANGLPIRGDSADQRRGVDLDTYGWTLVASGRRSASSIVEYEVDVVDWDPWFPNWSAMLNPSWQGNLAASWYYLTTAAHVPRDMRDALEHWIASRPELTSEVNSSFALAKKWEQWFIRGTELTYSLNLEVIDPEIDPVIDFLVNTKRGHCEYFASALAILLRMRGIPTRVVSGYKGGQLGLNGELVVRDLHAHLWVEAFVNDAPADPRTGQVGPRWITLDPTPPARDDMVQSQEQLVQSGWSQLQIAWAGLWSSSLRMSQYEQRALIYDPLRDAAVNLWESARGAASGQLGRRVWKFITTPSQWFSWQGGLAAFVLLSALCGLAYAVRRIWLRLSRRSAANRALAAGARSIPFYERFEELLRRRGMNRSPQQTPREFSDMADQTLRPPERVRDVPQVIVRRFYDVRYGGAELARNEAEEIDQQLEEFERELEVEALRAESLAMSRSKPK